MKKTFSIGLVLALCLTSVNRADEGTWLRKTDMPIARTCCGAATINGKIYVIGGGRSWYESAPPTAVYMYDPTMDTWEIKADMPTPRLTVETVTVDGKIYAIGGQRSSTPLRTLEVYDPELNEQLSEHFTATRKRSHLIKQIDLDHRSVPLKLRDAFCKLFSPYL